MRNGAIFISEDADVVTMERLNDLVKKFWHGSIKTATLLDEGGDVLFSLTEENPIPPDERVCPETGHMTTCMENCHPRGANCLTHAQVNKMADEISDERGEPVFIDRIAKMLYTGILSPQEARQMLERTLQPRIINFRGTQEQIQEVTDELNRTASASMIVSDKVIADLAPVDDAGREVMRRLYAQGLDVREVVDRMAMEGYSADTLLLGYDPGAEVAEPMVTFQAGTTGELESGDLVVVDGEGNARRAREGEQIIGVALNNNGLIRFTGGRMDMSWANRGSMAYHASIAYGGYGGAFPRLAPRPARYQYNERFPKEVIDKAMALLARFMSADQYKAFMEGSMIELQNKAEDHRVMLNRQGKFSILTGPRGEGIMMTSGNIGSFKYPIGDEIAVFLDWFRFRTRELIERWNCGTFSIKDYL